MGEAKMVCRDKTVLENQNLLVEINAWGSELARIYDKTHDREVIWDGDPKIWNRHAPILFPFIGKSYENQYRFQGKTYSITSHGFARDKEFAPVSRTENEVWYQLESSPETIEVYPFPFILMAGHRLEGRTLKVMWKVKNTGDTPMYFMIGGHPAFKTPKGCTVHDFTLDFHCAGKKDALHYQSPNGDGYQDEALSGSLALEEGKVPVTPGFFSKALTYIFDEGQVEKVSLLLPGKEPYVTVRCAGIPYLGVWTVEATHPFICLEPWYGRCDRDGWQGELTDRDGVVKLAAGQEFQAEYEIEIH